MIPTIVFVILSLPFMPVLHVAYSFDARMSRLVNGSLFSGRVELGGYSIYSKEIFWSTVDGRIFDTTEARVLCRSLGYSDGVVRKQTSFGQGRGSIYTITSCTGKEYSLWECSHKECVFGCDHRFDVGVECNGTAKVRLRDGSDRYSGIVEVFHHNEWGTLCDNNAHGTRNAAVVCRSLGFRGGIRLDWKNISSANKRPIWMSNVQCLGDEYSVAFCPYEAYENSPRKKTCTHANDLVIQCNPPTGCKLCAHMFSCDQVTNECTCERGWAGELCDEDINECSEPVTYYCPVNSTCRNTNGSYFCLGTQEKIRTDIKVVPIISVASGMGFIIVCLTVGFLFRLKLWPSKENRYTQFGQTPSVEPVIEDDPVSSGLESSHGSSETRVIGMAGPMLRVQPRGRNEISVTTETEYQASNDNEDEVGIDSHTEVKQIR